MKRVLFIVISLFLLSTICYAQQDNPESRNKINYLRTETNQPPTSIYQQPKEQVFPLGWDTNTLDKVNNGTGVWTELNPKVPRVNYIGLYFVNKDTGWACGGSGAIIKTTDGGDNWTISETPVTNLLFKLHSFNGQVVIAVGYDGIILRSGDGGETFEQVISGVGSGTQLWGVQILNDTLGWICGMNQTLLKTTDAGLMWQPIDPGLNQHYWALNFLNEQYGLVACETGKVLKTTDGGENWVIIQAGDSRSLYTIDVIDTQHIVAAGVEGKNIYSSDGGTNWTINQDMLENVNWVDFINSDTGYCVQDIFNLRKTTNRGESWFIPTDPYAKSEWHIQIFEEGTGYACGEEIGGSYALNFLKSIDGLDNWSRLFLNDNFYDVYFITETTGFALSGALYKTIDAGISWTRVENGPGGYDIFFLDTLTGFIAGTQKTIDGGETWYATNGGGTKVFFINNDIGWSIGGRNIYKTTNTGEEWILQFTHITDSFTSIFFVDSLNGWATSRYIHQTTDGGISWIQRTDIPAFLSNDIYFLNMDTGWVAAYNTINPSLFKTTDGGLVWNSVPEVVGARKFHYFPDPSHWLINGFGLRYITTDYGYSWVNIMNDVPPGIESFQAPTNFLGYAVGNSGLILMYEDTTYVPVELVVFTGHRQNKKIILEWQTATELNNYGFEIQRLIVNSQWEKIGFVPGRGTTTKESHYIFSDQNDQYGEIKYRLKQIDYNGSYNYSKIIVVSTLHIPADFKLFQNHPNPFNSSTLIIFQIPEDKFIKLKVYDILGNEVITLVNGQTQAGRYEIQFKTNDLQLTSGVYFYNVSGGEYNETKKLLLLK
jgi:photosystem II stability/assembly factor-like uncharacterized protein